MLDKVILIAYGLFLMVGGYFGYKKGSMVSLAMGVGCGLLVFLGVWLLTINPRSWIFLSAVCGFLSAVFLIRLVKTHAFMPSGMLLIISLAVLAFCLIRLR
jgi:uncharacterized membrane protein (UPF0136 family)